MILSRSMEEVTVPLAFTVKWKNACTVSSDPSEPRTMLMNLAPAVMALELALKRFELVKWPV
jgi:hypothetical protein